MKKYIPWLVFIFCLLLLVSMGRSIWSLWNKTDAIQEAEDQVQKLSDEQAGLLKLKEKVESEEYKEKEVRDKLGLAKPGEVVVILPSEEVLRSLSPDFDVEHFIEEDPIYKRWIKLFF